jgi:hypothetical protein
MAHERRQSSVALIMVEAWLDLAHTAARAAKICNGVKSSTDGDKIGNRFD